MPTYVLVFPVTNWTEFLYRCPVPDQGLVIPRNEGMLCFNRRLREGSEDDTCTGSYQYINIGNKVYSVPCSESSSCWVIPSTPHIRLSVGSQDDLNYPHWRTSSISYTFTQVNLANLPGSSKLQGATRRPGKYQHGRGCVTGPSHIGCTPWGQDEAREIWKDDWDCWWKQQGWGEGVVGQSRPRQGMDFGLRCRAAWDGWLLDGGAFS